MKSNRSTLTALAAFCLLPLACEGEKSPAAEAATAAPAPTPTPTPVAEPEPEEKKPTRPEKIETEVTSERRTKVESAVTEAKGFLVGMELEEKLKANKAADKKEVAITALDKMATGKWVLFTGPIANMTGSSFDLGITYTPQLPGDTMGMSRQWFPITFSEIEGYEEDKFKPGQMVVVLAKYDGKGKAGPGQELVETGHW
jgi:hypothetical protein